MRIDLPPKILAVSVLASALLNYILPIAHVVKQPYKLVGLIMLLVGIVFMVWARRTLQTHQTTLDPTKQPRSLITTGPFRISRNPFYVGYLLVTLGLAVFLGSLSSFFGPGLFFIWMNNWTIPQEEQNIAQAFGERYRTYKRRTRRWL